MYLYYNKYKTFLPENAQLVLQWKLFLCGTTLTDTTKLTAQNTDLQ